jgi:hypothetical protein
VLLAAKGAGLFALIVAAVFYISPSTAIDDWPCKLTPLTARVLASFTAQVGVGALVLPFDGRWTRVYRTRLPARFKLSASASRGLRSTFVRTRGV